ncbi:MAG: hypothetical protein ABI442_17070, partial [Gemmatimonadaceae bacterium]
MTNVVANNGTQFRFTGAIRDLSKSDLAALFDRSTSSDAAVRSDTAAIVGDVRARGDAALRELAAKFDGVTLGALEVPRD